MFLNADGTVKMHQKISDTEGGFTGTLDDDDSFGSSVAALGDLDDDNVGDLVVGASGDDDGGFFKNGAVWVLFLNVDGTVKAHQKISATQGDFTGTLENGDEFGSSVAGLGDLDGDGVGDLAVGARGDDDGGSDRGAVWVLFLNEGGTVTAHQKISDTEDGDLPCPGDVDGDGEVDYVDLLDLLAAWGPCDSCDNCPADVDDDCVVGLLDFLLVLTNWGPCP